MKKTEEILNEYGCPGIPFDENVTMYYPAILNAMQEYAEHYHQQKLEEVMPSKMLLQKAWFKGMEQGVISDHNDRDETNNERSSFEDWYKSTQEDK